MTNNHMSGSKVLQNPNFECLNMHFKPNMRKNSNSYMFRSVYQIDMKFDRKLRPAKETSWVDRKYFLFTGPSEDLVGGKCVLPGAILVFVMFYVLHRF